MIIKDITPASIAQYGMILDKDSAEIKFSTNEFSYAAKTLRYADICENTIGFLETNKREIKPQMLERHQWTDEILVEFKNDAIVFLASADKTNLMLADVEAFRLNEGSSILLNTGTWHSIPYPFSSSSSTTLIIKMKSGNEDVFIHDDCEFAEVR